MRLVKLNISYLLKFEKIYFFIVFLFAAQATYLTWQPDPRINPWGFLLLLVPTMLICKKYKINLLNKKLNSIYAVLFIWMFLQFVATGSHLPFMEIVVLLQVIVAYVIVRVYGLKITLYFEKIVVVLTFIDVLLWIIMQFVGLETMASLGFMQPANNISQASILIFNVPNNFGDDELISGLTRNCGFCWEPGMFACFLIFAIHFNLLRSSSIKKNYSLYILLIGILTSQSTTGYSVLILLLLYHFYFQNKNKFHRLIMLIVGVPIFAWMMSLSFMGAKIEHTLSSENFLMNSEISMDYFEKNERYMVVQRFEGLYLDFLNFIHNPIIGYGYRGNSYVAKKISPYLSMSNGLISVFAKWGIVIGFLMFYLYYKSSAYYDKIYNQKRRMFFVLFCVMSISYSFNLIALFTSIMFFPYFCNKKYIQI